MPTALRRRPSLAPARRVQRALWGLRRLAPQLSCGGGGGHRRRAGGWVASVARQRPRVARGRTWRRRSCGSSRTRPTLPALALLAAVPAPSAARRPFPPIPSSVCPPPPSFASRSYPARSTPSEMLATVACAHSAIVGSGTCKGGLCTGTPCLRARSVAAAGSVELWSYWFRSCAHRLEGHIGLAPPCVLSFFSQLWQKVSVKPRVVDDAYVPNVTMENTSNKVVWHMFVACCAFERTCRLARARAVGVLGARHSDVESIPHRAKLECGAPTRTRTMTSRMMPQIEILDRGGGECVSMPDWGYVLAASGIATIAQAHRISSHSCEPRCLAHLFRETLRVSTGACWCCRASVESVSTL